VCALAAVGEEGAEGRRELDAVGNSVCDKAGQASHNVLDRQVSDSLIDFNNSRTPSVTEIVWIAK
jgi:hypothetical protein